MDAKQQIGVVEQAKILNYNMEIRFKKKQKKTDKKTKKKTKCVNIDHQSKMTLEIPDYFSDNREFENAEYLLKKIAGSNIFEVKYLKSLSVLKIKESRRRNFVPFVLNNIMCVIDGSDTMHPVEIIDDTFFDNYNAYKNLKYIFKIEYTDSKKQVNKRLKEKYNIDIYPFFMYPKAVMYNYLGCFTWENKHYKYIGAITGKIWRTRRRWKDEIRNDKDFFSISDNNKNNFLSRSDYINLLKECKWGLCLRGKGIPEVKNNREVESMSFGMPLALNYKPIYPFDFISDKHYLYLDSPKDLEKLHTVDPMPFHEESKKMYNSYFNPKNIGNAFKKIFKHLFY